MDEFRKWLESFIKDKLSKIKKAAHMFQKESTSSFV
jgi:hypothetical protein